MSDKTNNWTIDDQEGSSLKLSACMWNQRTEADSSPSKEFWFFVVEVLSAVVVVVVVVIIIIVTIITLSRLF
jgi:hypothetical protein